MSDVLVRFVVPAYNEEALLPSCLDAIAAEISRTRCEVEIIVVNNGSTDGTRRIASSIPGVRVIDEPQRGIVQARKAGFRAAKGELIANIDADTMVTEGWLRTALAEFAHSPDLAALSGPYIYYDLPGTARLVSAGFYGVVYIVYLVTRFVLRAGSMMEGGNSIISRNALEAAGGFNPDFRFYGEDAETARRLSKVGAVKFTFSLRALSSGRRFAGEGLFSVLLRYSVNYLWTILFKRPFSPTWLDFRHTTGAGGNVLDASPAPVRIQPREAEPSRRRSDNRRAHSRCRPFSEQRTARSAEAGKLHAAEPAMAMSGLSRERAIKSSEVSSSDPNSIKSIARFQTPVRMRSRRAPFPPGVPLSSFAKRRPSDQAITRKDIRTATNAMMPRPSIRDIWPKGVLSDQEPNINR